MTQEFSQVTQEQVNVLAEKLQAFIDQLSDVEQQVLGQIFTRAGQPVDEESEGYGISTLPRIGLLGLYQTHLLPVGPVTPPAGSPSRTPGIQPGMMVGAKAKQ